MTIVVLDTETTGLAHDSEIWEIALIRREDDGTETVYHRFVEHDLDKVAGLPEWFAADHAARYRVYEAISWRQLAEELAPLMADRPHVLGAVPNFDTERLAALLREFSLEPFWHYHLIDIETYVAGYLHGRYGIRARLPWDSNLLSMAVGVEPPPDRHTALGDVRWILRTWDAMTGGATP